MASNPTNWTPNGNHLAILRAVQENGYSLSISGDAEER